MYSFVLLIIFATSVDNALSYVCYPNNTIIYDNPDPKYVAFLADNNDVICTIATINGDDGNIAKIQLSGCDINVGITLSMSTGTLSDNIVGGDGVRSVYIKCAEIDVLGITRTVTQGLSPSLSAVSEAAVSPTFEVTCALRLDGIEGPDQTTATVGDQLMWTYDVPSEYDALMTKCIVYAGTMVSGSGTSFITNGCSDDTDLVASFTAGYQTIIHTHRYCTNFYAFKFYNSDYITIHCTVLFCPTSLSSTACQVGCYAPVRKKRAISSEVDDPQIKYGTLSRVLKVFPKNEILSSSATKLVSSWFGVALFGATFVLRWV